MNIDLNYLRLSGKKEINQDVSIDESYFKNSDVRKLKDLHAEGLIQFNYDNDIIINLNLKGVMVLPCAISLEDVLYQFETNFEENLGKFDEIVKKNKNSLEISDILWENIVLEIPLRVVKEGVKPTNTSGEGWKLIS